MKRLIFSDTHLTTKFDQNLFEQLTNLIEPVDQVIINGDFWDGYTISFDKFIDSQWKKLFPLLLSKNSVYIYGNHDRKEYSDSRVEQFSKHSLEHYRVELDRNKELICYHGHQSSPTIDNWFPFLARKPLLNQASIGAMSAADKVFGAKIWQWKNHKQNQTQLSFANTKYPKSLVVNGHSHLPGQDNNWINCGMINYSRESYVIIDKNEPQLITTNWDN